MTVVGVGLSPRGNDRPLARSNVSTSPVRFLAALGRWYRASGREPPADGRLQLPPVSRTARPTRSSAAIPWPNAGFVNLDRIKQALWDAFAGTAQPTTVDGLQLYLDEVGWQVDTSGSRATSASRTSPSRREPPGRVYGELVRRARCDPDIAAGERLRLPRRRAAHGLPGGAAPRRRHAARLRPIAVRDAHRRTRRRARPRVAAARERSSGRGDLASPWSPG